MKSLFCQFLSALWEVLKLPFYLIAAGYKRLSRLGWHRLILLLAAALVITFVMMTTFFEVTSQPGFCGSCHIMRPYIKSWNESSHAGIHCMKCHAREGLTGYLETKFTAVSMLANYATGLYKRSKPWAEIEDQNCLTSGCHNTRLLDGKIDYVKGIVFDHTPHLTDERRGRKLRCTSCHSQIVQGEHLSVTSSTCALCHFKNVEAEHREKLADCHTCHQRPPQGGDAPYDHAWIESEGIDCKTCHQLMWQGSGGVRRERCDVCHSQTAHIDRIDDLEFIHEWHIEKRKVDCQQCHDPIEHRQQKVSTVIGSDCRTCHEAQHSPMLQVYLGTGAWLVGEPMPNRMHESGAVCMSCHKDPHTGHGMAGVDKSACTPCHDASYYRLAEDWRASFSKRITDLESAMSKVGTHPKIEDARHDIALIKRGGAWHNPGFADAVLIEAAEVIASAGGHVEPPVKLDEKSNACMVCHSGILEADVALDLSPFNHAAHIADRRISCTECHYETKPEQTNHGKRTEPLPSCNSCHHQAVSVAAGELCAPCHVPSRSLYTGSLPGVKTEASPMAAMEMTCTDCHSASIGYAPPKKEFCLDCHEAEVASDLEFLRGELTNLLPKPGSKSSPAARAIALDGGRAVHHPDLAKQVLGGRE